MTASIFSMRAPLVVTLGLAAAGLLGCYTVDFDQNADGVYYCTADADCSESQSCAQFVCVDDSGPQVGITSPELLQNVEFGTATIDVNYGSTTNFTVSESNSVVEGEGKMLVKVLGTDIEVLSVDPGAQLRHEQRDTP